MADDTQGDEQIFPRRQRRRRQLDTVDDVKRTLARTVRALERGKLAPPVATAMIAGLRTLLAAFEAEQDAKITAMEEEVASLVAAARARETASR